MLLNHQTVSYHDYFQHSVIYIGNGQVEIIKGDSAIDKR